MLTYPIMSARRESRSYIALLRPLGVHTVLTGPIKITFGKTLSKASDTRQLKQENRRLKKLMAERDLVVIPVSLGFCSEFP